MFLMFIFIAREWQVPFLNALNTEGSFAKDNFYQVMIIFISNEKSKLILPMKTCTI